MRELRDHQSNILNKSLKITVEDNYGAGGASCRYWIRNPQLAPVEIKFHAGPMEAGSESVNGITNDALLSIIIDRLRCFQHGPFPCVETETAIKHLLRGQYWLNQRTKEREQRGVEGKEVP